MSFTERCTKVFTFVNTAEKVVFDCDGHKIKEKKQYWNLYVCHFANNPKFRTEFKYSKHVHLSLLLLYYWNTAFNNNFLIRSPWLSLPFLERWWNARDPISNFLREYDKRFLTSGIFHESMLPRPLSIPLGLFNIFSKIHGDIWEWMLSPVSMSPAMSCSPVLSTPAITHFSRIFSDPRCRWYRQ